MKTSSSELKWAIGAIVALTSVVSCGKTESDVARDDSRPPNIVFILTDDQRYDQLGFVNPAIETPSLDKLAASGVHFRNAFVTTSLCSPSRASILTGVYTSRHGVVDNFVQDVAPGLEYFPSYLQSSGYETAYVGKWHMGHAQGEPRKGFDYWVSFAGQGSYFSQDLFGNDSWLNVNGQRVRQKGYITDELTDYALDWLSNRSSERPFFLYLSHKAVHAPFTPAPRHSELYADRELVAPPSQSDDPENYRGKPVWVRNQRNYFHGVDYPFYTENSVQEMQLSSDRALAAIDESLGRLLELLEERGELDNTLILFMGDNGFLWGEHGIIDKRAAYEESIRVPLLASFPGRFKAGIAVDEIVTNVDIAPTILSVAGVEVPEYMQGRSFASLAKGMEVADWPGELLYEYYWEWVFPVPPTTLALRTDRYKLIEYHGVWDIDEFYDLENDPREMVNLIDDSAHAELVSQMRDRLYTRLLEVGGGHTVVPYTQKHGPGAALRNADGSGAGEFPQSLVVEPDDPDRYQFLFRQMPDIAPKE